MEIMNFVLLVLVFLLSAGMIITLFMIKELDENYTKEIKYNETLKEVIDTITKK